MSREQQILETLNKGVRQLDLDISTEKLWHYLTLLNKWNQAYNLTAVREIESMVARHVLDSLSILPWIKGQRVVDVGSGAGLPGIPIAVALPQLQIVLMDSNGKKIRFLQEVKRALVLDNVEIVQTRVESYHPDIGFDTVVSRAFSDLGQMINWTLPLIAADGIWLAMKGQRPIAELATVQYPCRVEPYRVAGVEGERCCVIIERKESHGKNYSRC